MQTINIQVGLNGKSVRLALRQGASCGRAVLVASDEVEIYVAEEAPVGTAHPKAPAARSTSAVDSRDSDAIFKRLLKLKPTKRVTAVNSIKAMFQFTAPLSDEAANDVLEELRRRGYLEIDDAGKVRFLSNLESHTGSASRPSGCAPQA